MQVTDLGLIDYEQAARLQEQRVAQVIAGAQDTLFLLEHPPVITLGRFGGRENLCASPGALERMGVQLVQSSRGGNITCHYPGQLVAYPVFRVRKELGGVRGFVMRIEQAVIDLLDAQGIAAGRRESMPGVWIGRRKIAQLGIAVRRGVSYHGLALNVGPDLSLFGLITPCGIPDAEPTSICRELNRATYDMPEIKHDLAQRIAGHFASPALA